MNLLTRFSLLKNMCIAHAKHVIEIGYLKCLFVNVCDGYYNMYV